MTNYVLIEINPESGEKLFFSRKTKHMTRHLSQATMFTSPETALKWKFKLDAMPSGVVGKIEIHLIKSVDFVKCELNLVPNPD